MNLVDMIQFFANEYLYVTNLVLFIGEPTNEIKDIFRFIGSEFIVVDTVCGPCVDIVLKNGDLPFESKSFDLIIKMNDIEITNIMDFLKPNGKLLIKNNIYTVGEQTFSLL